MADAEFDIEACRAAYIESECPGITSWENLSLTEQTIHYPIFQKGYKAALAAMSVVPCGEQTPTPPLRLPVTHIGRTVDEIEAHAWPFIHEQAQSVPPLHGRIETYGYERGNGGVIALWDGKTIRGLAVTVRDQLNRTVCVCMASNGGPDQPGDSPADVDPANVPGIPLVLEDADELKGWEMGLDSIIEKCVICGQRTRHWHKASNSPVCPECGKSHSVAELLAIVKKPRHKK